MKLFDLFNKKESWEGSFEKTEISDQQIQICLYCGARNQAGNQICSHCFRNLKGI